TPGAQQRAAPVKGLVEDALTALWQGKIEDDGFNALVLDAHLTWRQIVVLRAYAKYLRQGGAALRPPAPARGAAFKWSCPPPAAGPALRIQVRPRAGAWRRRTGRSHRGGAPRPARRGGDPRPRPHPAQLPGTDPGHSAHEFFLRYALPGAVGHRRDAVPGAQA